MLPSTWQNVRRLLVIQLGDLEDVVLTTPALQMLARFAPSAVITLMATQAGSQLALQLPCVDQILLYEGAGFKSLNAERELALIELLSRSAFDACVIFTNAGESPYPLAYICYLAGIPIRLGQSQEFGGSVLSEWVKSKRSEDQHLFLLELAWFPSAQHLCDNYVS